jgi:hypothetical protein
VYLDEDPIDSVNRYVHAEWRALAHSAGLRASVLKGFHAINDREPSAMPADAVKDGLQSRTFDSMASAWKCVTEAQLSP